MSSPFASRITGTGSAFPERILTNTELSTFIDTNDAWVRERTGIAERRIAQAGLEAETNSSLATRAALRALEMAGKKPEDLDGILVATCTPDTLIPSTACWVQKKLGAKNAWATDLNSACSGFVYAVSMADQYLRSGNAKTILVVGSEVLSPFMNWQDRSTSIIFGDGAGAVIMERVAPNEPHRVYSTHMGSDGNLWELFHIPAGGSAVPVTHEIQNQQLDKMQMKGKEIFKEAVRTLVEYAEKALQENQMTVEQIDWVVPHQANLRILEAVAKRIRLPMEKMIVNIDRFGNTSAATVPTAFDEAVRSGRIRSGDTVLFDVFGAGLTYGSVLLRW